MKIKRGISLIVLVITIIVMIILAGSIILSLNNSGIIQQATGAVAKTDEATVKSLVQMKWAETYIESVQDGTINNEEKLLERLTKAVNSVLDELQDNKKLDKSEWGLVVTTSGAEVGRGWLQYGTIVTKGKTILRVGEIVKYDEKIDSYKSGWRLLGAENGSLLLLSYSHIRLDDGNTISYTLGSTNDLFKAQDDWLNGATRLNALCEMYGKGKGAVGARSVTVEDIDRIVRYRKEAYGEGLLDEYGNKVTYSYNGTEKPSYLSTNGKKGALTASRNNSFHFYNGEEFVHVNDLKTGAKETSFATLTSNYYVYDTSKMDTVDDDLYKTLFFGAGTGYTSFWLASNYVQPAANCPYFGMRIVHNGAVKTYYLWNSIGLTKTGAYGVRAVVTLDSNVKLKNTQTGWAII